MLDGDIKAGAYFIALGVGTILLTSITSFAQFDSLNQRVSLHFQLYADCGERHFRSLGKTSSIPFSEIEATVRDACGIYIEDARRAMTELGMRSRSQQNAIINSEYLKIVKSFERAYAAGKESKNTSTQKSQLPGGPSKSGCDPSVECALDKLCLASRDPSGKGLCAMTIQEAHASPLCIRYLFECQPPPPSYLCILWALSQRDRREAFYETRFEYAAQKCIHFSYEEAEAALRAKRTRWDW